MKKIIQVYQTADGKTFNSDQQADRHAEELLLHSMESLIKHCFSDAYRPSVIKAVEKLHENKEEAIFLLSAVIELLTFGDEN